MIREITIELPKSARLISGNAIRNNQGFVNHRVATAQHKVIASELGSTFPKCRLVVGDRINTFRITLTRISAGTLDGNDNKSSSFKWIIDAVVMWILGITDRKRAGRDDDDPRFEVKLLQQIGPTGYYGLVVRIEDDDPTFADVIVKKGLAPKVLGAPAHRPSKSKPVAPPKKAEQGALVFRRCWAALPWEQDPKSEDLVLVEAGRLSRLLDAPPAMSVIHPHTKLQVTLYRHEHVDPDLGGKVWLYTDQPPKLTVSPEGKVALDGRSVPRSTSRPSPQPQRQGTRS